MEGYKRNKIMEKEELRNILIEAIDEEHHKKVDEWLDNAETQFEHIANATNWPIQKIRDFYRSIGFEIGLRQRDLCIDESE